jgi:hypothetical protein
VMTKRSGYPGPVDALALYEDLVAHTRDIDRKGATMPYTSVNGHMFSFLDAAGSMALRLPRDARETFLHTYETVLVEQHGRIMKEYVVVPDGLLRNTAELQPWFDRSLGYVSSLIPKSTARG